MAEDWEGILGQEAVGIIGTSTSAILRVTQKGTGRIAEFKDETGVLSYIDNDGNLVGAGPAFSEITGAITSTQHGTLTGGDHTGNLNPENVYIKGPRPWVDARWYGLNPAASAAVNDAAIAAAIAALPNTGGTVLLPGDAPYSISSTVLLGNGAADTLSTRNNITFRGGGLGYRTLSAGQSGATTLKWVGASGGTMLKVVGPIHGLLVENLLLDCNSLAATGLDFQHPFASEFRNLNVVQYIGTGIKHYGISSTGTGSGSDDNLFLNVNCRRTVGTAANGIDIGSSTTTGALSRNLYMGCTWARSADAAAFSLIMRHIDHNTFIHIRLRSEPGGADTGKAIEVIPPTGDTTFPTNNTFIDVVPRGSVTVTGTWTALGGVFCWPLWAAEGGHDVGALHARFHGVSEYGRFFGELYGTPFQWLATTNFSLATAATEYLVAVGSGATSATAAGRNQKIVSALDLFKWTITLTAAPGGAASRTFTIFKNGVATAAVITITGADTTGSWSGTVSFAADDLIVIESAIAVATPTATNFASGIRGRETAA